jgi:hypothetical protein
MITLKTLPQATAQEVFDQVAKHLLTQMKKSVAKKNYCMYRGFDGTKCAAGCLISDDEYKLEFENHNWSHLSGTKYLVPEEHCYLITKLQDIHDYYEPEDWRVKLNNLAEKSNLKPIDF